MNVSIYFLKKMYKISKNDIKIHEKIKVTYKIIKIFIYLQMNTNKISLISTET